MAGGALGGLLGAALRLFGWYREDLIKSWFYDVDPVSQTVSALLFAGLCAFATTPLLLGALRFLASLGMGGEWSCGSVLVAESWPAEHRGKAMGLMQSGWAIGWTGPRVPCLQQLRDPPFPMLRRPRRAAPRRCHR